ncbi:MAG: ribonuclease III, partial [Chloroflexi bacterium]|nr:ribonuclease III [Chloroflexota bacterium]
LGEYMFISKGERVAGGHRRVPLLAGAFEALVGALYLDQGLDAVKQFWARFAEPHLQKILQGRLDKDAKSLLQELSQSVFQLKPLYQLLEQSGPDHAKEFVVEVHLGQRVLGTGRGFSKQSAEQEAAHAALVVLATEGHTAA